MIFTISQIFAVRSQEAVTIYLPLGENAADNTKAVCPASVRINSPVIAFQIFAVLSHEAVTTFVPSD